MATTPHENRAPPKISGRRLLSHEDLQARGIRFSRVHLLRLERSGLFPSHVKIGAGNFVAWFEDEIDAYFERVSATRLTDARAASARVAASAAATRAKHERLFEDANVRPARDTRELREWRASQARKAARPARTKRATAPKPTTPEASPN
jgi:predicted DNA-binding transcriptional regulator AlpA